MTFDDSHQLLHLTDAARDLGPLWAHSAFAFEAGNGHIIKLVEAAKLCPLTGLREDYVAARGGHFAPILALP